MDEYHKRKQKMLSNKADSFEWAKKEILNEKQKKKKKHQKTKKQGTW